jgi:hypothetical protein
VWAHDGDLARRLHAWLTARDVRGLVEETQALADALAEDLKAPPPRVQEQVRLEVRAALEDARVVVKPVVKRIREGELVSGDLLDLRLKSRDFRR